MLEEHKKIRDRWRAIPVKYFRRTVSEVKPTLERVPYKRVSENTRGNFHGQHVPRACRAKKTDAEVRGKYGQRGQRDRGNVRYGLTAEHCGDWPFHG